MTTRAQVAGVACAILCGGCAPMDRSDPMVPVYRESPACRASARVGGRLTWAYFNNPDHPCAQDPRMPGDANIANELVRLIDAAPQGSTIRGHIFSIKSVPIAEALEQAVERGVHVALSLDGSRERSEAQDIVTNLPEARVCKAPDPDGTTHGCLSNVPGAIAHTKLFTFSQTLPPSSSTMTEAVWLGSFNLTEGRDGNLGFNDTVTVYGDPTLFVNLAGYAQRMWESAVDPDKRTDHVEPTTEGFDPTTTFLPITRSDLRLHASAHVQLSPKMELKGDMVVTSLLETLPGPDCSVLLAQAWLTDGRRAVTEQLVAMKQGGCDVRFVGIASHLEQTELERLAAAGIPVRGGTVHNKFFLVKGISAQSSTLQFRVVTGSHNLEGTAQKHNDELLAEMAAESEDSHPLYDAYKAHFEEAWKAASPISEQK